MLFSALRRVSDAVETTHLGGNNAAVRKTPYLELPDSLRRFSHEELLAGTDSMSPARLLGTGGFGPVYMMQDSSGRNFAAKVGTNAGEACVGQGRNEFENEALLLWLWQHERIIRLEGVSIGQVPCLVYEYMAGGSLASILSNPARAAAFSARQRVMVAADVAHALAYLHEGGCGSEPRENPRVRHAVVLHRDVNSSNVLLDGDLRGKLGDFGLCAMVHQADVHRGMVLSGNQLMGQWAWTAPEAQELGNMPASDVYALGLIILQLLAGCDDTDLPLVRASAAQAAGPPVVDPRLPPDLSWPPAVAETVLEIALQCSEAAASARPEASQVLAALVSALSLLEVSYALSEPVRQVGTRTARFEPCRIDRSGQVRTLLHFTPPRGQGSNAQQGSAGRLSGSHASAGGSGHEGDAGVLRMYKWEGPCGRGASEDKKREAAVVSVVAVVCCSTEDAIAMLDYCGWDVTHAVERFLAGHPVPPPRPGRHAVATAEVSNARAAASATDMHMPPHSGAAASTGGGDGGEGVAAAAGAAGKVSEQGPGNSGVVEGWRRRGKEAQGVGVGINAGMVLLPEGTGSGTGRLELGHGSSFMGSWVDGIVEGHGHFQCRDKEFEGEFVHGRMHGKGVHRWKTNDGLLEYDGMWHEGQMHGTGIVTQGAQRRRFQCSFEHGRLTQQKSLIKEKLSEEERDYMVSIFQSVLCESTKAEAIACLSDHEWDLQSAIKGALAGNPSRVLFDGELPLLCPHLLPGKSRVASSGQALVRV
jgi:serine/threonine protein kinase